MKKFYFVFLSFIVALFAININVKAAETRSFSEWVSSYGYAGERILGSFSNGECIGVVGNNQSVCAIQYNGYVMVFTTDPQTNAIFRGPESQFPTNAGYIDRNWISTVSTLNLGSLYSPFSGVDLSSVFNLDSTSVWWRAYGNGSIVTNNCDVNYTSLNNFVSEMEDNGWQNPNDPDRLGGLPVLTYTTSTSTTYRFLHGFDKKAFLKWDFNEKEPYKSQSQNFCVDIIVSGRLNTSGPILTNDLSMDSAHQVVLSNGGTNVASNEFSWLYQATGAKFYETYGLSKFPEHDNNAQGQSEGYRVYVRTRNVNTNESSAWKIYNFIGGIFSSAGYAQDDSNPNNPTIKPLTPDNSDNDDYTVRYDPDSNTSAQADPTGQNYKGDYNYDPTTLFNNLKSAVNSISELPGMFAQIVTFVPQWLISLIFISIGMLVVIGLVKIVLN